MWKIFFVGVTGHIGGAVLDLLHSRYPNVEITALVRNERHSKELASKYPNVIPVLGDLDSLDVIETEAHKADIVINTAPDVTHETGIAAILRGLQIPGGRKGYYIHTSGAALIWDDPDGSKTGERIRDDVGDIKEITGMDESRTHRKADKLVLSAAETINVAIVSPAHVYGLSPSPFHPFPITLPDILRTVTNVGGGFTISEGLNTHSFIHVLDLAEMYLLLLSYALGKHNPDTDAQELKPEVWGEKAYYFGGDKELAFADYMAALVSVLVQKGLVNKSNIRKIDVETAARASGASPPPGIPPPPPDTWAQHIAIMFGVDMRVRSTRASKLGWRAQQADIRDTLLEVVDRYLESKKQQ